MPSNLTITFRWHNLQYASSPDPLPLVKGLVCESSMHTSVMVYLASFPGHLKGRGKTAWYTVCACVKVYQNPGTS